MSPVHPDTLSALTSGIQAEVASYVFYVEALKKAQMADHKDVLEKLAHEEKEHFHILERQYDSLVRSEKWISTADVLKKGGLPEIGEDMTGQHRELVAEVARAKDLETILDIAYRLEEDAHNIYKNALKTVLSAEGKKVFEELAKFEAGHMALIEDMQRRLLR